jgi:hypothetical protein
LTRAVNVANVADRPAAEECADHFDRRVIDEGVSDEKEARGAV